MDKIVPLKSSFLLMALLGLMITIVYTVFGSISVDWGVAIGLVFLLMFIASFVSMRKAPVAFQLNKTSENKLKSSTQEILAEAEGTISKKRVRPVTIDLTPSKKTKIVSKNPVKKVSKKRPKRVVKKKPVRNKPKKVVKKPVRNKPKKVVKKHPVKKNVSKKKPKRVVKKVVKKKKKK